MHPSFITGIHNVKRMRHKAKEKHSFKINQQASKDTYQKALYRQSCIHQPNRYDRSQATTTAALTSCQAVTLMWFCLLSRRGLQEIIWIICRKQISHFTTQAPAYGCSALSFKHRLGLGPQRGCFSSEVSLPAPLPYTTPEVVCNRINEYSENLRQKYSAFKQQSMGHMPGKTNDVPFSV